MDAYNILHTVIVEVGSVCESVIAIGCHTSRWHRIGSIAESQVLLARTVCLETDCHHIGRIGNEVTALVGYVIFLELHYGQCRVQWENTFVTAHVHSTQPGFYVKFSHSGKVAKAERLFTIRFVRHFAIEIFTCQHCSLLLVSFAEGLAYFVQYVCRLLVHIPVGFCSFWGVRSPSPESFLIESDALCLYRAHDVGTDASVSYR